MADVRELDQIQVEIERLHERSQNNKAEIQSHEAVCEERYTQIVNTMQELKEELNMVHQKLNEVSELASQGKTSLKTLLWLGGIVAGIAAFLATILNMIPK